jgi:hypothetical protein
VPGVRKARRELLQNLDRFKESLVQAMGGSSIKVGPQKIWEEEGVYGMPKGLGRCRQAL